MFLLERDGEAVDDGAEDLEELADAVVSLCLVHKSVENVANGLADEGAVGHELPINAVQDGLQVVSFTRVFRVEQFYELEAERLVCELLGYLSVHLGAYDEAEEELVDDLQVRPAVLQDGFVLLRIEVLVIRRQGTADVGLHHCHDIRHQSLLLTVRYR